MTIKLCRNCKSFSKVMGEFHCTNINVRAAADDVKAGEYLVCGDETKLAIVKCGTARSNRKLCGRIGQLFEAKND